MDDHGRDQPKHILELHNSQILWKSDDDHPEQQLLELEPYSSFVEEVEPDSIVVELEQDFLVGTMVLRSWSSLCAFCSVDEEQGLCQVLPCQLLYRALKSLN
jgi:hypothetical protein